ncbi:MAG: protein translocase subunit SecD [Marmoricola sp.]
MAKKPFHAGRTLIVFVLAVAVLYGLAALGGTWAPRLGLDLQGGTRITLIASGTPSATKLKQAANIINQRVNGSGVTEATVSTQGNRNIVVEIPGQNRQDLVDAVKRTALLRFRVVAYCPQLGGDFCISGPPQAANPSSSPSPSSNPSSSTSPSASPSAQPSSKVSGTPTTKASPTAGSNPRPAPAYALTKAKTTKPSAKPTQKSAQKSTQKPATPAATAVATPQATPSASTQGNSALPENAGAKASDYLAWTKDPGTVWQLLYAVSKCDPQSHVALVPKIANTLDVANPPSVKQVQQQVKSLKPKDLVRMVDEPGRPLISCGVDNEKYLLSVAVINGTQLKSAAAVQDQQSLGSWVVSLTFKGDAVGTFADLSRKMVPSSSSPYANGRFAIVLDGQTLSAPGFTGVIPDGTAQITGNFTQASAATLADALKFGALPVKFEPDVYTQTIGPSLAGNQLSAGLIAGGLGLLVVMIYCLLYYRGLGTVVIASLILAALVTYAIVLILGKTAGFALTLPGIAGLIVAVGITADSFIVYFERIRDEMRTGKSMRVAVQAGWKRARNTCLAADAVSVLAALVLYIFGIGVVKGFAFALGISTLIDLVVFFWFTHPMMTALSHRRFFNSGHRLSGLSADTLGVDGDRRVAGGRI